MNKKIWLSSFVVAPLLIMSLRLNSAEIKIGYCPTMLSYVAALQSEELVDLVAYDSSQEALQSLQSRKVDLIVIGRKAKSQEITNNIFSRQIDLTATTLVKTINKNENEAFLILWQDLDYENVELIVITDELGNKLAEHRSPFLYYSNQLDLSQVEKISSLIREKI
jgi:hypothetical protein